MPKTRQRDDDAGTTDKGGFDAKGNPSGLTPNERRMGLGGDHTGHGGAHQAGGTGRHDGTSHAGTSGAPASGSKAPPGMVAGLGGMVDAQGSVKAVNTGSHAGHSGPEMGHELNVHATHEAASANGIDAEAFVKKFVSRESNFNPGQTDEQKHAGALTVLNDATAARTMGGLDGDPKERAQVSGAATKAALAGDGDALRKILTEAGGKVDGMSDDMLVNVWSTNSHMYNHSILNTNSDGFALTHIRSLNDNAGDGTPKGDLGFYNDKGQYPQWDSQEQGKRFLDSMPATNGRGGSADAPVTSDAGTSDTCECDTPDAAMESRHDSMIDTPKQATDGTSGRSDAFDAAMDQGLDGLIDTLQESKDRASGRSDTFDAAMDQGLDGLIDTLQESKDRKSGRRDTFDAAMDQGLDGLIDTLREGTGHAAGAGHGVGGHGVGGHGGTNHADMSGAPASGSRAPSGLVTNLGNLVDAEGNVKAANTGQDSGHSGPEMGHMLNVHATYEAASANGIDVDAFVKDFVSRGDNFDVRKSDEQKHAGALVVLNDMVAARTMGGLGGDPLERAQVSGAATKAALAGDGDALRKILTEAGGNLDGMSDDMLVNTWSTNSHMYNHSILRTGSDGFELTHIRSLNDNALDGTAKGTLGFYNDSGHYPQWDAQGHAQRFLDSAPGLNG